MSLLFGNEEILKRWTVKREYVTVEYLLVRIRREHRIVLESETTTEYLGRQRKDGAFQEYPESIILTLRETLPKAEAEKLIAEIYPYLRR